MTAEADELRRMSDKTRKELHHFCQSRLSDPALAEEAKTTLLQLDSIEREQREQALASRTSSVSRLSSLSGSARMNAELEREREIEQAIARRRLTPSYIFMQLGKAVLAILGLDVGALTGMSMGGGTLALLLPVVISGTLLLLFRLHDERLAQKWRDEMFPSEPTVP